MVDAFSVFAPMSILYYIIAIDIGGVYVRAPVCVLCQTY